MSLLYPFPFSSLLNLAISNKQPMQCMSDWAIHTWRRTNLSHVTGRCDIYRTARSLWTCFTNRGHLTPHLSNLFRTQLNFRGETMCNGTKRPRHLWYFTSSSKHTPRTIIRTAISIAASSSSTELNKQTIYNETAWNTAQYWKFRQKHHPFWKICRTAYCWQHYPKQKHFKKFAVAVFIKNLPFWALLNS